MAQENTANTDKDDAKKTTRTEKQETAQNAKLQAMKDGKLKALQSAMSKIEKDFGKGSIMRMGDERIQDVDVIPTVQKVLVKQHWPFMPLLKHRNVVVLLHLSMQNMPLTAFMLPI